MIGVNSIKADYGKSIHGKPIEGGYDHNPTIHPDINYLQHLPLSLITSLKDGG